MFYYRPSTAEIHDQTPITLQVADVEHVQSPLDEPTISLPFGVVVSSTDPDFAAWYTQLETPEDKHNAQPPLPVPVLSIGNVMADPFVALADANKEITTLTEEKIALTEEVGALKEENTNLGERLFTTQIDLLDARIELYQKAKRENDLEYLAMHDEATGLLNRRGLIATLEQRIQDGWKPSQIGVFDMTNLKRVNDCDRQGHAGGDYALLRFAQATLRGIRDDIDLLARTGGDEMTMVIMENNGPRELREANARRQVITIRGRVGLGVESFLESNPDLHYTDLSYAFVEYDPTRSLQELFVAADIAAKEDKERQHGRKPGYRTAPPQTDIATFGLEAPDWLKARQESERAAMLRPLNLDVE